MGPLLAIGLSAASSGIQSIFGAMSGNAQTNAANKLAIAQYKQAQADRLSNYIGNIGVYNAKKMQYKFGDRAKTEAFYRGIGENQRWLNDIRSNLNISDLNSLTDMLQKQGAFAAGNAAQGASSARVGRMMASQRGQQQALAQEGLRSASEAARAKNQELLGIYRRERMNDWLPLTVRPDPGFAPAKPILQGGQSLFGAALQGVVTGAISGAMGADWGGGSGYKPPNLGNGLPTSWSGGF